MDPFGRDIDASVITPKQPEILEELIDNSKIRIFLFMKEKPDIDSDEKVTIAVRPPWDISTNIATPPKYLSNGLLNPARTRPSSASDCRHYSGAATMRPFSAPCGYPEYSSWKHPMDLQPYLTLSEMRNFRRYSSVTDLRAVENNPVVRTKASRLLASRSSTG